MKNRFLFFLFFLTTFMVLADFPEKYDWEANRKRYNVGAEDLKVPAVILKDKRIIEYLLNESQGLIVYKTIHKIILVNSDDAIDQFNKVYIPVEEENSLMDIKARSINKNGKVTLLDKSNLKEMKGGEELALYKIFAIEGLEIGSEIEYIYTVKKNASPFGREYIQAGIPSRNVSLDIISPKHLEFEAKSYNRLPNFLDSSFSDKKCLFISVDSINAAVDEEYAPYTANLKRVDFKLSYNLEAGKGRLYTWADASDRVFRQACMYTPVEISKVKKLCRTQKFSSVSGEEARIKAIENYIKSNYMLKQGDSPDFVMLDKITENRYGDEVGMIRLFEAILSQLKIDHRIVVTSDRSEAKFDGKFDSYNFLTNTMFYFPNTNKYLTPTIMEMRYGMVPFYWTNNEGLFIKKIKAKKGYNPIAEIKYISALPSMDNIDNIYADITISEDLDNVKLHVKRKIGGYNAMAFQPYYKLIDAEKQKHLNEELMSFISKDGEFSNIKVDNIDPNESVIEKPFIIEGDIQLSSLIDKAGNKYFFKVGEVLGRQSELYSDKKRVNPVENDFNRVYIREIKVKIPEGYTFKNLEDIKKSVVYDDEGKKAIGFISDYKMDGNTLVINIDEYYNKIDFPVSAYENFRKVINAAADFNKVVLILEKK